MGRRRPKAFRLAGGERDERRPDGAGRRRSSRPPRSPRIAWEDEHLLVVDKPAGLVVHPAPGHRAVTLVDLLAERAGGEWQPHVVHRLDRNTSGLMLVAKTRPCRQPAARCDPAPGGSARVPRAARGRLGREERDDRCADRARRPQAHPDVHPHRQAARGPHSFRGGALPGRLHAGAGPPRDGPHASDPGPLRGDRATRSAATPNTGGAASWAQAPVPAQRPDRPSPIRRPAHRARRSSPLARRPGGGARHGRPAPKTAAGRHHAAPPLMLARQIGGPIMEVGKRMPASTLPKRPGCPETCVDWPLTGGQPGPSTAIVDPAHADVALPGWEPSGSARVPRVGVDRVTSQKRELNVTEVGIRELLEAGVHFGHQTRRWHPKMRRYIFGERDGIYIIDLAEVGRHARDGRASSPTTSRRAAGSSCSSAPRSRPRTRSRRWPRRPACRT